MNDLKLIKHIVKSPDKGIREAINVYGGMIKAVCCRILKGCDSYDVDEACSDTFFRLWKNAAKYDGSIPLKAYICMLARSSAIDILRKKSRVAPVDTAEYDIADVSINPEDEFIRKEMQTVVRQAVENMDEPDRSVFVLRYFYFFSVKDIALELDIDSKKVENILYRKKALLRKLLVERGITYNENI